MQSLEPLSTPKGHFRKCGKATNELCIVWALQGAGGGTEKPTLGHNSSAVDSPWDLGPSLFSSRVLFLSISKILGYKLMVSMVLRLQDLDNRAGHMLQGPAKNVIYPIVWEPDES